MRQGVVLPETARERRERELLQDDVAGSPLRGRRIEQRLRNFTPSADSYLVALGGPLPYMTRLRAIHVQTAEHERQLRRSGSSSPMTSTATSSSSRAAGARRPSAGTSPR